MIYTAHCFTIHTKCNFTMHTSHHPPKDHTAYYNLNLLLEISLMQPQAVREETQVVCTLGCSIPNTWTEFG